MKKYDVIEMSVNQLHKAIDERIERMEASWSYEEVATLAREVALLADRAEELTTEELRMVVARA